MSSGGYAAGLASDRGHAGAYVPYHALSWVALGLEMPYRIRYFALDRRTRKYVKNRYRYTRTYGWVRPAQRLRLGLRLFPLHVLLRPERRWGLRLCGLVTDLL